MVLSYWKIFQHVFESGKKSTFFPKIGGILIFFFKFLMGIWHFFFEKKVLWFCSKLAQMGFRQYKFIQIWNIPISDFSNWKKIRFTLKNSTFGGQKRFPDLAQNWLIWGSDNINLLNFGTFRIPIFPIGKKSNLVFSFGNFGSKTPTRRGLFLGILVQKHQRGQAFSSF